MGSEHTITLLVRSSFACRLAEIGHDLGELVSHLHRHGVTHLAIVQMLGNGKLNAVIPLLRQELSQHQGQELMDALSALRGSYQHKNKMAERLESGLPLGGHMHDMHVESCSSVMTATVR